jgi:hypothetical protein
MELMTFLKHQQYIVKKNYMDNVLEFLNWNTNKRKVVIIMTITLNQNGH